MKAKDTILILAIIGGVYLLVKYRKDQMKKDCNSKGGIFTSKLLGGDCLITTTT
jgi:hypothetical protein